MAWFRIVSLKAFGDVVIALNCLQAEAATHRSSLIIGRHLAGLVETLDPALTPWTVVGDDLEVPAVFDLKRRGVLKGLKSALRLRDELGRLELEEHAVFVFDRLGARERFIAAGRTSLGLPAQSNIYQAYAKLLDLPPGAGIEECKPPLNPSATTVGIFPVSRIARKNIPTSLVGEVARRCLDAGLSPVVVLLEGEHLHFEGQGLRCEVIPRTFRSLLDAVRSFPRLVCADSLPAHLGELKGRQVFVLTPVPNTYWLPLSCYLRDRWSTFDMTPENAGRISEFLGLAS
jgi:hypothetical protein